MLMKMKNNEIINISNVKDFIDLINESIGTEAGDYLSTILNKADSQKIAEKMKFESDYNGLEGTIDEYHAVMTESCEILEQISNSSDRMTKLRISQKIMEVVEKMMSVL